MKEKEIKETESIEEVANDIAILCGECNSVFQSIIECEEHLKTHPSKCYKCDFKSENSEELNSHELKEHKLRQCDSGQVITDEIDNHQESVQDNPVQFACKFCNHEEETKENLEKHVLASHMTVKVDLKRKDQLVM